MKKEKVLGANVLHIICFQDVVRRELKEFLCEANLKSTPQPQTAYTRTRFYE